MNDKEKQIEEIKQVINNHYHNGNIASKKSLSEKIYDKLFSEDSVVLSREEYKNLKHYENEMYRLQGVVDTLTNEGWDILDEKEEKIRKVERKETAEKYCELKKYLVELHCECLKAKTENSGKYEKANTGSDRDRYYIEFHKVNANIELIKK